MLLLSCLFKGESLRNSSSLRNHWLKPQEWAAPVFFPASDRPHPHPFFFFYPKIKGFGLKNLRTCEVIPVGARGGNAVGDRGASEKWTLVCESETWVLIQW